jgi:hypothetical protein
VKANSALQIPVPEWLPLPTETVCTKTSEVLKAVVRFKISWQDNCSYTLKLDKVIRNENKINFPSDLQIKVKIIETTAGGYTQETSSSLTNGTYKVVVTRLN